MSDATPRPWAFMPDTPIVCRQKMPHNEADTFFASVFGPGKYRVALLDFGYGGKHDEANARLIVRSVNAHDALMAALSLTADLVEAMTLDDAMSQAMTRDAVVQARAAIALAEKGEA